MQITWVQRHRRDSETGGQEHGAARAVRRSSMKPPQSASDNLIDRTRHVWKARLGRDLSREDARQIVANVTGFFSLLGEWSRAEMQSPANDAGKPDAPEDGEARHDG